MSGRDANQLQRDVLTLADSVNQLAIAIEAMLPLTRNSGLYVDDARRIRSDVQKALRKERERVTTIIERYADA